MHQSRPVRGFSSPPEAHARDLGNASWSQQMGAGGFLGMTLETLEKTYGHHHPDYQKEGADRYGPVRETPPGD